MKKCCLVLRRQILSTAPVIRFCLLAGVLLLAGCAPTLYYWGDYTESLEQRYEKENPNRAEQLLREQMTEYNTGNKVPPGIYADYGFLLYRRGDTGGAIAFFEKEKKTFPESALLMDKLINRIKQKTAQDSSKTSSSAGEKRP